MNESTLDRDFDRIFNSMFTAPKRDYFLSDSSGLNSAKTKQLDEALLSFPHPERANSEQKFLSTDFTIYDAEVLKRAANAQLVVKNAQQYQNSNVMYFAASACNVLVLERLYKFGVDIHVRGWYGAPIIGAIQNINIKSLVFLLENGARTRCALDRAFERAVLRTGLHMQDENNHAFVILRFENSQLLSAIFQLNTDDIKGIAAELSEEDRKILTCLCRSTARVYENQSGKQLLNS